MPEPAVVEGGGGGVLEADGEAELILLLLPGREADHLQGQVFPAPRMKDHELAG